LCTTDDEVKEYTAEIERIDMNHEDSNKSFVIRVTDKELLEETGGIIQGLSGSPIIQDGKLVGAVTHVLVNDPTRGYGIFIENMLDAED
jgi:stage IV sporulation protein B